MALSSFGRRVFHRRILEEDNARHCRRGPYEKVFYLDHLDLRSGIERGMNSLERCAGPALGCRRDTAGMTGGEALAPRKKGSWQRYCAAWCMRGKVEGVDWMAMRYGSVDWMCFQVEFSEQGWARSMRHRLSQASKVEVKQVAGGLLWGHPPPCSPVGCDLC